MTKSQIVCLIFLTLFSLPIIWFLKYKLKEKLDSFDIIMFLCLIVLELIAGIGSWP